MIKRVIFATVVGVSLAAAACTFTAKAGDHVPGFAGSEITLEVDGPGVSCPATSTSPPAGTCIKFTFFDGGGNPIGSAEGEVGGDPVPAPDGTEEVGVSPCDPEEDPEEPEPKKKAKKRSSTQHSVVGGLEEFGFHLMPFNFDDGHARQVEYVVVASNSDEAEDASAEFVKNLFAEPCEAQVTPYSAADIELLPDGRVRFSMFSLEAPLSLAFDWNDAPLFTLADASVAAANGWYVTTVYVPADMVDVSGFGSSTNTATYLMGVTGRDIGTSLQLTITP